MLGIPILYTIAHTERSGYADAACGGLNVCLDCWPGRGPRPKKMKKEGKHARSNTTGRIFNVMCAWLNHNVFITVLAHKLFENRFQQIANTNSVAFCPFPFVVCFGCCSIPFDVRAACPLCVRGALFCISAATMTAAAVVAATVLPTPRTTSSNARWRIVGTYNILVHFVRNTEHTLIVCLVLAHSCTFAVLLPCVTR